MVCRLCTLGRCATDVPVFSDRVSLFLIHFLVSSDPPAVPFPSCSVPSILDSVWLTLNHPPLCSLSLCQFNHFSHFKMTIPQFYRSSCLSLPVSTLTALTPSVLTFCLFQLNTTYTPLVQAPLTPPTELITDCMGYVYNYFSCFSLI